jgi:hypothetical protein
MSGPYRTPGKPGEVEEAATTATTDLGVLTSEHARSGALATATAGIGGWSRLDLHENGLVLRNPLGTLLVIAFDEIDAVHYDCDALLGGPPRIVLVTFDGTRTAIPSDLQDLERVIRAIDRAVTRPVTARALEALSRGERLTFGPVVIELDGVVVNGRMLPWSDLREVVGERDSLVFHAREPQGRFGWVRLFAIPHPRVLLDVLRVRTTVVMRGLGLSASGPEKS